MAIPPITNRDKKLDFSKNRINKIPIPKEIKKRKRFVPQKTPERLSKIAAVIKIKKDK